jgi:hypothetical protein
LYESDSKTGGKIEVMAINKTSFVYRNSLSIVLIVLFLLSLIGQSITGWHEYNKEQIELGSAGVSFSDYIPSGHFIQTTFENWESEFLQMGLYVWLTIFLRQKGSSESKHLVIKEEVDRRPDPNKKNAPWPVKKGGFVLTLYKNSLLIAFIVLFLASFALHVCGSVSDYNHEQILKGDQTVTVAQYLTESRFWYESFQNWQSEFIAVLSIVVLSIFLRQHGSPESKPVDAPDFETGSS